MPSPTDPSLSVERWDRIMELFAAATEQPPEEQEPFLREACGDDAALYRHVAGLLAMDSSDDSLLTTREGFWASVVGETASLVGETVGPYRLEAELGRGGMGVVYRARRDDVGTVVALKFLRDRFPLPSHLERFLQEQRIVGQLDHPGIARFLDAGITQDGTPFFAMEYVEGRPITEVCLDRTCPAPERIRLFLDVCDAVQYAHRNLVIHRDLKPSNVLVTDEGQVKLLDFGIAKLLAADDGDLTRTSDALLTPAYAAPEQVSGEAVSTVTDVYALGVLLYELLTGCRPIDVADASFSEVVDRILHREPALPSRASDPERGGLPPGPLRGDLDLICRRALEKDPEDRFASVGALRDDLRRHLDDRPIEATTVPLGRRVQKFVRRNRDWFAAGVAALLVLATLIAVYTVQLQQERDLARTEAAKAREVSAFVTDLFEANMPVDVPTDTIRARTLLARGLAEVDALSDQPAVQAQMLAVIGDIYARLGRLEMADSLLARSLALRRDLFGPEPHASVAATLVSLGYVRSDRSMMEAADTLLREAVDQYDRLYRKPHPDRATAYQRLGSHLALTGDYDDAQAVHESALAMRERLHGPDAPETAESRHALAAVFHYQGELDTAEDLYRKALRAITTRQDGSIAEADVRSDLAALLTDRARYAEAEALHREALALRRTLLGDRHPETAVSLGNLGSAVQWQGRFTKAMPYLEEALSIREEVLGPMHVSVGTTLNQMAVVANALGRPADAVELYRRVLEIYESHYGDEHFHTAIAWSNLGRALFNLERRQDAVDAFEASLGVYAASVGTDHWQAGYTKVFLSDVHATAGRYAEAAPLLRSAYCSFEAANGPDHPTSIATGERLVDLLRVWKGRPAAELLVDSLTAAGMPPASLLARLSPPS